MAVYTENATTAGIDDFLKPHHLISEEAKMFRVLSSDASLDTTRMS